MHRLGIKLNSMVTNNGLQETRLNGEWKWGVPSHLSKSDVLGNRKRLTQMLHPVTLSVSDSSCMTSSTRNKQMKKTTWSAERQERCKMYITHISIFYCMDYGSCLYRQVAIIFHLIIDIHLHKQSCFIVKHHVDWTLAY